MYMFTVAMPKAILASPATIASVASIACKQARNEQYPVRAL